MSETTATTVETTAATQSVEEVTAELARARDALKAANREAADRRKKLDEYEKAEKERKDAELSEMDKLTKRLAEAESNSQRVMTTANERLIRAAFVAEAAMHGVEHPEDAFLLADKTGITVDESGNVPGVEAAVKLLVDGKRLPLRNARAASTDAGAGSNATQKQTLTDQELEIARKLGLKPEDYAAHKRR